MKKTYSNPRRKKVHLDESLPSRTKLPVPDEEEKKHFKKVVCSFRSYRSLVLKKFNTNKRLLESLPEHQQQLLNGYKESLIEIDKCVEHNQELIELIVKDVEHMFENLGPTDIYSPDDQKPTQVDVDRVQATLKQFVRDWSSEGAEERDACYQPIIEEVIKYFPPETCQTSNIKVLVPGSGLGRLAFEIAAKGYICQGNEFSLYMLIASHFVLNKCQRTDMYSVYPWLHQVDNNLTADHQMQKISFPDVNPSEYLKQQSPSHFTMAAGDFLEIYKEAGEWNCVATCFFIDCANNIVDFVEKIFHILTPGGIWINLGPLLYHYSNMPKEFSLEPPYSVVKEVITGVGFIMEKEEIGVKTTYGQNPNSMLQYEYNSVFFVCRKPKPGSDITVPDVTS